MRTLRGLSFLLCVLLSIHVSVALAQVQINESLTGGSSSYNWLPLEGACLTAGDGSGTIPKCDGLPTYQGKVQVGGVNGRLPDPSGSGALRLTNGDFEAGSNGNGQRGAVISNFTFPATQGVKISFTSYTYGGNNLEGRGADGMAFFLADGNYPASIGSAGGALGYSCGGCEFCFTDSTNGGVIQGIIGLGIDEWGNYSGTGTVGLRGRGDVNWPSLNRLYPYYFPSTLTEWERGLAISKVCRSGHLYNFNNAALVDKNGQLVQSRERTSEPVTTYPILSSYKFPADMPISNQGATFMPKRPLANAIRHFIEITPAGLLTYSFSYKGGDPIYVFNEYQIGALPDKLRFGFSAATGGGSNVHEVNCFKADSISQSFSSAAGNVLNQQRVEGAAQLFLSSYRKSLNVGTVTATDLVVSNQRLSVSSRPNWDANCVLTGGLCAATEQTLTADDPQRRVALSWSGSSGIPLRWDALPASVKSVFNEGDGQGAKRLDYLRGSRVQEPLSATPRFRKRFGLVGDIVHSSPVWVGSPQITYSSGQKDLLHKRSLPEMSTYNSFRLANAGRLNMVYVGANDGFLHGFRAGYGPVVSGQSRDNDGKEMLAFSPMKILLAMRGDRPQLDFTHPNYSHNYYVDAQPGSGDVYANGKWQTWLVGGYGYGGDRRGPQLDANASSKGGFYLLNITDPSQFTESNAASIVMGEWDSDSLQCVGTPNCGRHLGNVSGTPLIRRLHDGSWAAILGNGTFSQSGEAGIFILQGRPNSDEITVRYLKAAGSGFKKNAIVNISTADLDGDRVTDYVYAGDVLGNVWRFDLTSTDANSWRVGSRPIFRTGGAPISTKIEVSQWVPTYGMPKVLLTFGTGQVLPQTIESAEQYSQSSHALYGIWDADFASWNQSSIYAYGSLSRAGTVNVTALETHQLDDGNDNGMAVRTIQANDFCWVGDIGCGTPKMGWRILLPRENEQIVFNPVAIADLVFFTTTIPGKPKGWCDESVLSGYTIAVSVKNGGGPKAPIYPEITDGKWNNQNIAGLALGGVGTAMIVQTTQGSFLVQQTALSKPQVVKLGLRSLGEAGRITWRRLR